VPTATPLGRGGGVAPSRLSTSALGQLPPIFTPLPTLEIVTGLLPDTLSTPRLAPDAVSIPAPALPALGPQAPYGQVSEAEGPPTPIGPPPDRLVIPRLGLDAPVEPVGMTPSAVAGGVFEWEVPDHRAAGWLNTSAPFGLPGNTVLDGHHNVKGEVFRDLWTLQAGDEITLYAGEQLRRYRASQALILPEKDQPLEVRLANARYIQPSEDERLTLVTCWPYENNTHRTVVVALPQEEDR